MHAPRTMGVSILLAAGVMAAGAAAQPPQAPVTFLVSLQGRATTVSASERDRDVRTENGVCHLHETNRGDDVLDYASVRPTRIVLAHGATTALVTVRYRFVVTGTYTPVTTGATCPPPPWPGPFDWTGCRTYEGTLAVRLRITDGAVSVGPAGAPLADAHCPGNHGLAIDLARGGVTLDRLLARPTTTVSGHLVRELRPQDVQITSDFRARFARA